MKDESERALAMAPAPFLAASGGARRGLLPIFRTGTTAAAISYPLAIALRSAKNSKTNEGRQEGDTMPQSRTPRLSRTLLVAPAAAGLAVALPALAAETGFESLSEGFHGEVLEVDGITFSNFGDWFDPPGSGQVAAIDDATQWLSEIEPEMSEYVQGNILNVNGYSSPGYTFFRVQSMEMTTGQREVGASVSFLYVAADPKGESWKENEAVLELYLDGELVASEGAFLDNVLGVSKAGTEYGAGRITIEDVEFDRAKITTRGPVEEGTFLGGFDNFVLGLGGGCRPDLDGDGELTFFDFLAFQNLFAAGDLTADFDGNGELDFFDFLAFQNEFSAGCP